MEILDLQAVPRAMREALQDACESHEVQASGVGGLSLLPSHLRRGVLVSLRSHGLPSGSCNARRSLLCRPGRACGHRRSEPDCPVATI